MSATNRGAKRREKDFYPTPRHVITPLLRHVDFTDALSLEPCRGNGAIYDELPDPRTYDEIWTVWITLPSLTEPTSALRTHRLAWPPSLWRSQLLSARR